MSIETPKLTEEEADNLAMLEHAFKKVPLDPEIAKRVHERGEAVRADLPVTNIAVDLIRDVRDE